jgi:hypothetical protein
VTGSPSDRPRHGPSGMMDQPDPQVSKVPVPPRGGWGKLHGLGGVDDELEAVVQAIGPAMAARLCGVSASTVRRWLRREARPRPAAAARLRFGALVVQMVSYVDDVPVAGRWLRSSHPLLGYQVPLLVLAQGEPGSAAWGEVGRAAGHWAWGCPAEVPVDAHGSRLTRRSLPTVGEDPTGEAPNGSDDAESR